MPGDTHRLLSDREQRGGRHDLDDAVEPVGIERGPVVDNGRGDAAQRHPGQRDADRDQDAFTDVASRQAAYTSTAAIASPKPP